ncbi:FRG domain-containing protein [Streptococcus sobrinus]|uniref:FRG domain-containing protein n=1 Tax=Streptococcus sobrinus TaxID=1310 RepID=UPI000314C875|nr:FRG domain-containing protein [Streptococcus sobrinus]
MGKADRNFYDSLGSFFCSENATEIINNLNCKIYDNTNIEVTIIATDSFENVDEEQKTDFPLYRIDHLSVSGDTDGFLNSFVDSINKNLENYEDNGGYKNKGNHWTVFYLLKEIISELELRGYNYFRGQRESWPAVPAVFRSKVDNNGNYYYQRFEQLYKEVSNEFPERISYVPLEDKVEKLNLRADALAILQHYNLPTSLLDITDNPFIALLFMAGSDSGEINKPQFEAYKIDKDKHTESSILSFVRKKSDNQRIKAQHGSFINYDKLIKFATFKKDEVEISEQFSKIPKVTVTLNFSIEETKRFLDKEKEKISSIEESSRKVLVDISTLNNLIGKTEKEISKEIQSMVGGNSADNNSILLSTKKYTQTNIDDIENSLSSVKCESEYYRILQGEIIRKLGEYGYRSHLLFPDFEDYLVHLSGSFKEREQSGKTEISISNLDS